MVDIILGENATTISLFKEPANKIKSQKVLFCFTLIDVNGFIRCQHVASCTDNQVDSKEASNSNQQWWWSQFYGGTPKKGQFGYTRSACQFKTSNCQLHSWIQGAQRKPPLALRA